MPDLPDRSDPRTLHTARTLPASPERVWQALTDPAQLARWWGPAGFANEVQRGGIDGLIKSLQQKNAASEKPRTAQAEQK